MSKSDKKLTVSEIKELVRLLKKVRLPAPYPVFIALCKSVPMIAVDLAFISDDGRVFLTHRKDEFYEGWHIPGSILTTGESVKHAIKRVARKELGIDSLKSEFVNHIYYNDIRESGISLLFAVSSKSEPKGGKYFSLNKIPKNFINDQMGVMDALKKWRGRSRVRI